MAYAVGILPSRSFECQNVLADDLSVFWCGLSPVFPDRAPGISETLFVSISILRNNSCDSVRVSHRQPESRWRAIIEHIDCIVVDCERLHERLHCQRQVIKRVNILSLG